VRQGEMSMRKSQSVPQLPRYRSKALTVLFGYGNHSLDFLEPPGWSSPTSARVASSVSESSRSDQVVSLVGFHSNNFYD